MSVIQAENIDDVVSTVLASIPAPRWGMIAQNLVDYPILNQMLRSKDSRCKGSYQMEHRLMVTQSETAKNVGLYDDDDYAVQDNFKTITAPWRHTTNNFIYDVLEKAFNEGDASTLAHKIVDLIETRRVDCMLGIAEKMEVDFWGKPSSSTDETTPWGIQYWLKLATSSRGFNGGDITGFSGGPGGVSSDTYTNWKHYNAVYDAFTDDDLSSEMRRAFRACDFKSPVKSMSGEGAQGYKYKIFTGEEVQEGLIQIARHQNDNIGRDISAYDGGVVFKKIPFQYVPAIDSTWTSTEYPIFMLDTKHFKVKVNSKNAWRQTGPVPVSGKHNVRAVHYDVSWNTWCTNRRHQAVINRV